MLKLNLNEIEALVQLQAYDFCDYGNSELEQERYIAKMRQKIGYCVKHLEIQKDQT